MKKNCHLFMAAFIFMGSFCNGQVPIKYGSNMGRYQNVLHTKIYYEEYGRGTPLLMLHGGLGGIADFSRCIPELSRHFHLIIPDAPGLGKSEMSDSISYELLADYAGALVDSLRLDSAYVIGWSDGGNAALILAGKRPDKIKKVLASGANYLFSGFNFSDSLKPVPTDFVPSADYQKWIDETFGASKIYWRKVINDRIRMWSQPVYYSPAILEAIKVPVLLVVGDRDAVKLEHAVQMYQLIKGSQFCVLPNTSHAVFSEKANLIDEMAIHFFEN